MNQFDQRNRIFSSVHQPRIFSASSSAYLAGCHTIKGAPKQAEKVAVGSLMPIWRGRRSRLGVTKLAPMLRRENHCKTYGLHWFTGDLVIAFKTFSHGQPAHQMNVHLRLAGNPIN